MKNLWMLLMVLGLWTISDTTVQAQSKTIPASPAKEAQGKIGNAEITVNYSSPGVKGRKIWGDLVPYNQVWRAGANESTKVKTSKDLKIADKVLPAGTYSFYVLPKKDAKWTVIFSKDLESWGSFDYEEGKDALRLDVDPVEEKDLAERLTYEVTKNAIVLKWEKVSLTIPVSGK